MLETLTEISLDPHVSEQLKEDWIYPFLLAIYLFCLLHALSIIHISEFSSFKANCLSVVYLMSPFIFFLLCRTADIIGSECLLHCIQKPEGHHLEHLSFSRSMGVGVLVFWWFIIPLHRYLNEKLQALQKS
jgi:hypothetical protein